MAAGETVRQDYVKEYDDKTDDKVVDDKQTAFAPAVMMSCGGDDEGRSEDRIEEDSDGKDVASEAEHDCDKLSDRDLPELPTAGDSSGSFQQDNDRSQFCTSGALGQSQPTDEELPVLRPPKRKLPLEGKKVVHPDTLVLPNLSSSFDVEPNISTVFRNRAADHSGLVPLPFGTVEKQALEQANYLPTSFKQFMKFFVSVSTSSDLKCAVTNAASTSSRSGAENVSNTSLLHSAPKSIFSSVASDGGAAGSSTSTSSTGLSDKWKVVHSPSPMTSPNKEHSYNSIDSLAGGVGGTYSSPSSSRSQSYAWSGHEPYRGVMDNGRPDRSPRKFLPFSRVPVPGNSSDFYNYYKARPKGAGVDPYTGGTDLGYQHLTTTSRHQPEPSAPRPGACPWWSTQLDQSGRRQQVRPPSTAAAERALEQESEGREERQRGERVTQEENLQQQRQILQQENLIIPISGDSSEGEPLSPEEGALIIALDEPPKDQDRQQQQQQQQRQQQQQEEKQQEEEQEQQEEKQQEEEQEQQEEEEQQQEQPAPPLPPPSPPAAAAAAAPHPGLEYGVQKVMEVFPHADVVHVRRLLEIFLDHHDLDQALNLTMDNVLQGLPPPPFAEDNPPVAPNPPAHVTMVHMEKKRKDFFREFKDPCLYPFGMAADRLSMDFRFVRQDTINAVLKCYNGHYAPAYRCLDQSLKNLIQQESIDESPAGLLKKAKELKGGQPALKINAGESGEETLNCGLMKGLRAYNPLKNEVKHPVLQAEIDFVMQHLKQEKEELDGKLAWEYIREEYEKVGQFIQCGCCFSEEPFENLVQCFEGHLFCCQCLEAYVREAVFGFGKLQLTCMTANCLSTFPRSQMVKALSKDLLLKFEERQTEEELNKAAIEDLVVCPKCNMRVILDSHIQVLRCPNSTCLKETCRKCKVDWSEHRGKSCQQIEKKTETTIRTTYEEKMTAVRLRTCPRCKLCFMKEVGCNRMHCRCGMTICYLCCKTGIAYSHFCQHLREPGEPCRRCTKCSLWSNPEEDEERAIAQIQKEAQVRRREEGFMEEQLIGAPDEPAPKRPRPD